MSLTATDSLSVLGPGGRCLLSTRSLRRLTEPRHWSTGEYVFRPVLSVGDLVRLDASTADLLKVGGLGRTSLREILHARAELMEVKP